MMTEPGGPPDTHEQPRVLVVDNDEDIAEVVTAILSDEGYAVTALNETRHDAIAAVVGRLEPDCVLLDGAGAGPEFGGSWAEAAYFSKRERAVPTVMFTAHADAVHEARERTTERARAADFAAVVAKPFGLDELLAAVEAATGRSDRFDRSEEGERARTAALIAALEAGGATDIRASNRREWATFVSPQDHRIYQLYWWQSLGRYMLGRYDDEARLEVIGRHFEREAAIEAALGTSVPAP